MLGPRVAVWRRRVDAAGARLFSRYHCRTRERSLASNLSIPNESTIIGQISGTLTGRAMDLGNNDYRGTGVISAPSCTFGLVCCGSRCDDGVRARAWTPSALRRNGVGWAGEGQEAVRFRFRYDSEDARSPDHLPRKDRTTARPRAALARVGLTTMSWELEGIQCCDTSGSLGASF